MMLAYLTLGLLFLSLIHLFLSVYNRWLLCLRRGPWKLPIHAAWFVVSVAVPVVFLLLFFQSGVVQEALSWSPQSEPGRLVYVAQVALVVFFGARVVLWLMDRLAPDRPGALLDVTVSRPVLPTVAPRLPRGLRSLETTGELLLVHREIAVSGLAPAFEGLTIAQVSDVHFGQRLEMENYLLGVRELVAQLDADVVVLTGDFVDRKRDIARAIEYHAGFRGKLATLCVMGNHDYWANPDRIREAIARTHIRWLGNGERRVLKRVGRRVVFTGTDAPWDGARPDWRRLVRRETGDAVILLSHTPDNAPSAAKHGASLILSGHIHGGQICVPLLGPVVSPSRFGLRYAGGLYRVGADSLVNVSRGVGVSSGGIRVLCAPEVCLLTLRAPSVEVMVGQVVTARTLLRRPEAEEATGV